MKILSSASARPNFVKLAAVHHAASSLSNITHSILHTGQHYDPLFSDVFFQELQLPEPIANLGIHGGTREEVIARTDAAARSILAHEKPSWVLVYGDVNGALGVAQAAKALGIPLAHVEAGLRSGDLSMPEEHNRIAIDRIADLLLVSEQSGMEHLAKEGSNGRAVLVGNTMIDTLIRMLPLAEKSVPPFALPTRYAVATLHRPSNVDDPVVLQNLLAFLSEISAHIPVILPLHRRTKAAIDSSHLADSLPKSVMIVEPLPYLEFLHLLLHSSFLLTDSGGIQEEATVLKKRCFTLRRNTERPSTIESGCNVLIDPSQKSDRANVLSFAENSPSIHVSVPPLWDGKTGERILQELLQD